MKLEEQIQRLAEIGLSLNQGITVDDLLASFSREELEKDNGQSSIWFYLTEPQALALNELADNVFNLRSKPWWRFW